MTDFVSSLNYSWAELGWSWLTDWLFVSLSQPVLSTQYWAVCLLSSPALGVEKQTSSLAWLMWQCDTLTQSFLARKIFGKFYWECFCSGNLDWNICRYEVRGKTLDCTLKNDKVFNWQYVLIWLSFYRFIRLFIKFYNRKRSMAGLIYSYQIILNFMQIIPLQKIYHWPSFKKISSASCSL